MDENFDFQLVEEFGGYNSSRDKTTLKPNFLIRGSKNVYKKISGTIASREGLKRRGSADSTDAGVKSSFEWKTSKGQERPLRVANGKLQVESDIATPGTYVWYELFATGAPTTSLATTLTRFVFDTWWFEAAKKDRLIFVRGDDKIFHWSGGMGMVSPGLVTGAVTGISFVAGSNYVVGDVLTIGGGDGLAKVVVLSVNGGGQPSSVTLIHQGSGYVSASGVSLSGGSGTGAQANITAGNVSSLVLSDGNPEDLNFANMSTSVVTGERKVMVNGTEYTYVGLSENALTGVTPDPAGEAANSIAIQSVLIADDEPIDGFKCDFIKTIANQLFVGSYSSRTIYISADVQGNGLFDFENAGAHVPGDPDTIVLDNPAKGIGIKDGQAVIFAGDSDLYVVELNVNLPISFTDPADGGDRFVINKVQKKVLPSLNAALGHEFISNFENDLVWLDQKNQLRALSDVVSIDQPIPTHLSLPVKEELSEDDFTGGHLRVIGDTIHITAPNNGRDWMYTIRQTLTDQGGVTYEKIWQPPQVRGISRFAVIDGVIYGHSNVNPQIYQVFDTVQWFDDNPNDEPIPYNCTARFAYRNSGRRYLRNVFDKYYIEGYMPQGVELNLGVYMEYQGAESFMEKVINSSSEPAKFWQGNPYPSLGDSSLGNNPLGDGIIPEGGEQEQVPKFRKIVRIIPVDSFEHTIDVYSTAADSRWEILAIGPNLVESESLPVFL